MSQKAQSHFLRYGLIIAMISVAPHFAQAGFEWVPSTAGSAPPSPQVNRAPPPTLQPAPEIISPVIITGDTDYKTISSAPLSNGAAPSPPTPAQQNAPTDANAAPLPLLQPATNSAGDTAPMAESDVVKGFAAQIPLALALRQLLPIGYQFTIDPAVDMNVAVSYKGGKPWRETLKDMLAPVGLVGRDLGNAYIVSKVAAPTVPPDDVVIVPPSAPSSPVPSAQPPRQPEGVPISVSTAAPRTDMPSYNVNASEGWTANHGETLHKVLTAWCRRAGVELQWQEEYDYPVEASAHFSGSFEEAVRDFLTGFENARPQPIGELHRNASAGQEVLVIQPRGNSYSN